MFDMSKIKTFKLEDLVGRTVTIREFKDSSCVITSAIDIESGELFVLSQHQEASPEPLPSACSLTPEKIPSAAEQSSGLWGNDPSILG